MKRKNWINCTFHSTTSNSLCTWIVPGTRSRHFVITVMRNNWQTQMWGPFSCIHKSRTVGFEHKEPRKFPHQPIKPELFWKVALKMFIIYRYNVCLINFVIQQYLSKLTKCFTNKILYFQFRVSYCSSSTTFKILMIH